MKDLYVYFDLLCPFCRKGLEDLFDILKNKTDITPVWMPLEAHPRPEVCDQYTDVASAAVISAISHGANAEKLIRSIYRALIDEGGRADDAKLLTRLAEDAGADAGKVASDLAEGKFLPEVERNNTEAWDEKLYDAVPDYRAGERELRSSAGEMISRAQLERFILSLEECVRYGNDT